MVIPSNLKFTSTHARRHQTTLQQQIENFRTRSSKIEIKPFIMYSSTFFVAAMAPLAFARLHTTTFPAGPEWCTTTVTSSVLPTKGPDCHYKTCDWSCWLDEIITQPANCWEGFHMVTETATLDCPRPTGCAQECETGWSVVMATPTPTPSPSSYPSWSPTSVPSSWSPTSVPTSLYPTSVPNYPHY